MKIFRISLLAILLIALCFLGPCTYITEVKRAQLVDSIRQQGPIYLLLEDSCGRLISDNYQLERAIDNNHHTIGIKEQQINQLRRERNKEKRINDNYINSIVSESQNLINIRKQVVETDDSLRKLDDLPFDLADCHKQVARLTNGNNNDENYTPAPQASNPDVPKIDITYYKILDKNDTPTNRLKDAVKIILFLSSDYNITGNNNRVYVRFVVTNDPSRVQSVSDARNEFTEKVLPIEPKPELKFEFKFSEVVKTDKPGYVTVTVFWQSKILDDDTYYIPYR